LKILYHHRIRSKDGQAVHLEELIAALRGLGHEVLLVGPTAFARASFGHDPKFLALAKRLIPNLIYELLEIGYNVPARLRLRRACKSFAPDVIYERYNLYLTAGIACARRLGLPLLLEVNAPLSRERASFGGLGFPRLAKRLERRIWRSADFVLPVTGVLAGEIVADGVSPERIVLIPNAIDPAKFAPEENSETAKRKLNMSGKLVLGFTGFVRDWHGMDSILRLLARADVPANLHLLIVGDGPAIPDLMAQSRELGIADRVTFAGLIGREELPLFVSAFDIALLPKCVAYCSPLKLFEYMASGKAIVAPDQANIREIVASGESALLFDRDSPDDMSSAVLRLANDVEFRARLGCAAQALVGSRGYTWRRNAERVTALVPCAHPKPERAIPAAT
jgi:glycosyltransferase involved in cell wall biosynthesis